MKVLASALVLTAAAFTARGEAALRGSAGLTSDTGYNGLTLFLDHVKTGTASSDDVVLGAIVDSYNKVHDKYAIKSAFKNEEIAIPEAGSNGSYYDSLGRFTVGWECSSCAADEGFLPPMHVVAQASPGLHQKFVDELCQALRDSGKEAYAGVTKCAVDFTYGVEQLKRMEEEAATSAAGAAPGGTLYWPWSRKSDEGPHSSLPMAAELELHGVGTGATQDYGDVTKAFIDAYNEVHADTPYRIDTFGADKVITVREDGDQDDGSGGSSNALQLAPRDCKTCRWLSIIGRGRWGCTMCRDDRSVLPPMETMLVQYKESRFKVMEKLFCYYIVSRGTGIYQNVRGCKINLVAPSDDGSSLAVTRRE